MDIDPGMARTKVVLTLVRGRGADGMILIPAAVAKKRPSHKKEIKDSMNLEQSLHSAAG